MTDTEKAVRAVVGGMVQGVGYRAWVQAEARARGVAGWVRNCENGDVEAVFAGPAAAVEALCAACWRGPVQARVARVEVTAEPAGTMTQAGSSQRFEVRF